MQQNDTSDTNKAKSSIGSPNTPDNFVEGAGIDLEDVRVGHALEAASFDGKWYYGKVVYVDESDETFLVHFDGWNTRFDEWYKYTSKKVRPLPPNTDQNRKKVAVFKPGDNVLAKWIDNKFYMCHVVRTRPGDKYEVRFEDGVLYTVDANKVRIADKIDELTESTRLLKQQESIERAKSREVRLQRRSNIHNDNTFISPSIHTSTHSVAISEMTDLEERLCLSVRISLSDVYLNSSEKDEDTPYLTLYPGKTYSVRSFSAVLGPDLEYLAEADSDVASTAPSTPLSLTGPKDLSLRKRRDPPILSSAPNTSTRDDVTESDIVTQTQSVVISHSSPPVNLETQDPQPVTQPLLPLTQTSPPLLSSYAPSIPYTETIVTADGRVLTLTPSYQPAPPPAPVPDVTNQPLYYQLVPIQVNPPSNPPSIPVEQSYLTIQQPYSYPYQTQYAPVVQQYSSSLPPPTSSLLPSHSLALSTSLQPTSTISLPTSTQLIQDTAYASQIHTMDVQPQETISSYLDQVTQLSHNPSPQVYQSIESQHKDDVRLLSDHSTEQTDYVISDSESDKVLFIDTQSADQQKNDVTSRARKSSLSEEENRELKKLRLPDHNRKVAPRELVTTLETELFVCKRAGCNKDFHRRESLKKHMRVFHGSSPLEKKTKMIEKPHPKPSQMSPIYSPVSTPEPIPTLQPHFPSSSDHSITHTELLFQDPVSSHRSKRKSSQPRKSSFPEPTTPTVTIVIPSDPSEVASPPKTPPQQTTVPPAVTNPTIPSRQSKRISIKKNLDFDTNYKTVRKNTKLKDKLDRQDALKKDVRTQLSNPRLQQEMKEKAILKMKPPLQHLEPLSDAVQPIEISEQTPLAEIPQDRNSNDVTGHVIDADVESVVLVEETQTDLSVNSPIEVIDLMETNVTEISQSKQVDVTESSHLEVDLNSENKSNNYSSGSEIDDDVSLEDIVTSVNPQELIRCVCDQDKDEGVMVQCEQCMTWQHTSCLGLSEKDLPDQHICSECSDPPACIKREQYKHCNPWYRSGKIMFPTDTELVETGAHLSSLKNQLSALENMIPSVNLKIQIAKNGNHPYLKEFLSTSCNILSPAEIKDKLASLSYLTNKHTDIHEKCTESTDNPDNDTSPDVKSDNETINVILESEEQIQHTQPINQPETETPNRHNNIPADTVDPNLTSLLIALNDSSWGCEMRLFDNIENIQNNILDRFSSIEMGLNSLRYRIPDSDISSLTDTLSKLDSIRTCLS